MDMESSSRKKRLSLDSSLLEMNSEIQNDTDVIIGKLDSFLGKTIHNSQFQLNDDAFTSNILPSADDPLATISLSLRQALECNAQLKSDLESMENAFLKFKHETMKWKNDCFLQCTNNLNNFKTSVRADLKKSLEIIDKVMDQNADIKEELDFFKEEINPRFYALEKELSDLQQYIRRPSIEVTGISESIPQYRLEKFMIDEILKPIGIHVTEDDIEACHRMKRKDPNKLANVVIRFMNRKHAVKAIKNRYRFKQIRGMKDVFIIDSLCPKYTEIFDELYDLKNEGFIKQVWTYNGKVSYKKSGHKWSPGTRVFHKDDMKNLRDEYHEHLTSKMHDHDMVDNDHHPISTVETLPNTSAPIAESTEDVSTRINDLLRSASDGESPSSSPVSNDTVHQRNSSQATSNFDQAESLSDLLDAQGESMPELESSSTNADDEPEVVNGASSPDLVSSSNNTSQINELPDALDTLAPINMDLGITVDNIPDVSVISKSETCSAPLPNEVARASIDNVELHQLNSTSTDLPASGIVEVAMNISAIASNPEEELNPLDDPVFVENMKKDFETFRFEYKQWAQSPQRLSNGGLGSGNLI